MTGFPERYGRFRDLQWVTVRAGKVPIDIAGREELDRARIPDIRSGRLYIEAEP